MVIQEYNEGWIYQFESISKVLKRALTSINRIDHIGSTSIKGMCAKPVIDIDIVIDTEKDFSITKNELENIGYVHVGDQGIKGREVFKRNSIHQDSILDKIKHHLYVCLSDSDELKRHVLFRNYLRTHNKEMNDYINIKKEIVAKYGSDNREKYVEVKENVYKWFFEGIIKLAIEEENKHPTTASPCLRLQGSLQVKHMLTKKNSQNKEILMPSFLAFFRKAIFIAIFMVPLVSSAQMTKQDSIWQPLKFFVGNWKGKGSGEPGIGEYERTYRFVLNNRFIEAKNKSTFPPSDKNSKGELHEQFDYFSYDKGRHCFVLRQFHIEGFVNQYKLDSISADGKRIVFVSEAIENIPAGWRAKETYQILNDNQFQETFELAEPNKQFEVYTTATLNRID